MIAITQWARVLGERALIRPITPRRWFPPFWKAQYSTQQRVCTVTPCAKTERGLIADAIDSHLQWFHAANQKYRFRCKINANNAARLRPTIVATPKHALILEPWQLQLNIVCISYAFRIPLTYRNYSFEWIISHS